jgi:hypothetical protein
MASLVPNEEETEAAVFGLVIAAKLGQLEKALATALVHEQGADRSSVDVATQKLALALGIKENRVLPALGVLQAKGLLTISVTLNLAAMAALGEDYRAALRRMGHDR